ncbi:hypothetical protein C3L33_15426, partial [Rhododendron williamsianum]
MAKNMGIIVCLVIIILDIIAGILGIEAEVAQNKMKHMKVWIFECREPSYQAFKLGLAAAALLALAHAISNLLGGCIFIWSKDAVSKASPNRQLAAASLVFSWIIVAVAFSMLIIGALTNSRSRKSCGLPHHRLLSIGGILCFIHAILAIVYYASATGTAREERIRQHGTAREEKIPQHGTHV